MRGTLVIMAYEITLNGYDTGITFFSEREARIYASNYQVNENAEVIEIFQGEYPENDW